MLQITYNEHHRVRFGMALNRLIKRVWMRDADCPIYHYIIKEVDIVEKGDITLVERVRINVRQIGFEKQSHYYALNNRTWTGFHEVTPQWMFRQSLDALRSSYLQPVQRKQLSQALIRPYSVKAIETAKCLPTPLTDALIQQGLLFGILHRIPA